MSNPLLDNSTLPPFSSIKAEHVVAAISELIAESSKAVKDILASVDEPDWDNFVQPLDEVGNKLRKAWSPVGHMNAVVNSLELRKAYETCLPLLSEYYTEMGQNKELYDAYLKISEGADFKNLSETKRKIISNELRDFKLSGIALPAEKQKRYGELQKSLSELSSSYSNNVLDATMSWTRLVDSLDDLSGIPENALQAAAEAAKAKDLEGWLFTLEFPSYYPVMTHCSNRELRLEMYTAHVTRASAGGPDASKFDNSEKMEDILKLRHELAQLLGFNNFAEHSLATKMAPSTNAVLKFLNDLAERSLPQANSEIDVMKEFAASELGIEELNAWDTAFVAEKLRQHKYAISQEELRPYFAADRAVQGMFEIVNRLYGITFEQVEEFDSWHSDVRFYKILRDGQHIASFYLDLFARANKRGGAWMDECRCRMKNSDGELQLPVAYLVCNFTAPVGDDPALLTHTEIVTLFHEFGHGLHHTLTEVDELGVSGIGGVAWDAVELPSQIMENWCWEKEGLDLVAEHYKTGEQLPQAMIDKLLAAKNFNSAISMLRQLEMALFDFRMHCEYGTEAYKGIQGTLDEVRSKVSVIKAPKFNQFQNAFSHIFAGGYSAGYYSYKWAEVLSADAFSKFEEQGIFNRETGLEFLSSLLGRGGSADAAELFEKFRGRAPEVDALLRHSGINNA